MPDQPNTIFLCDPEPLVEMKAPFVLPGRVAVLMHSGEKRGGLLAPPSGVLNPDVGVVVASGTSLREQAEVICRPYHGQWRDNWLETGRQMRFFGVICPWHESIVAVRTPIGLEPTHDWVLLEEIAEETRIILPEIIRNERKFGKIVAFGPHCGDLTLGAGCVYENVDVLDFAFGMKGHVLVRAKHLLAEF